jgi:hypothetical protein
MDINGDGYISVSEVSDVTTLNISGSPFDKKSRVKIENIKGIDGFKNLTVLSM